MRSIFVLALIVAACVATLPFKNLQGSPDEFPLHNLPSPNDATVSSDSYTFPINFKTENNEVPQWTGEIAVDSNTMFVVSLVAKNSYDAQLEVLHVTDVQGHAVLDLPVPSEVEKSWFGTDEKHSLPTKSFIFKVPTQGLWRIRITNTKAVINSNGPDMYVFSYNESPDRVNSHLLKYETYTGGQVGVLASFSHHTDNGNKIRDEAVVADLDVTTPKGDHYIVHMHDDGLHGDGEAFDGVYGATFTATDDGNYVAKVVMTGSVPATNGGVIPFIRSTQHLIAIVDKDIELISSHELAINANDEMATVYLNAKKLGDKVVGRKYKAYAEVWGTDANGQPKAIAWIAGMTVAEKVDENLVKLPLKLNMKWVSKANVQLPITLKNVYVQDVANSVPLTHLQAATVRLAAHSTFGNSALFRYTRDEESMFFGKRPESHGRTNGTNAAGHKVILMHGYCSSDVPFRASDFTNHVVFVDADQSRTHDEYALILGEFGSQYDSFATVGHSQAGPVALHLYSFYWSNQDTAPANSQHRIIQSVGAPYRGSGLAGSIASLGSFFGVGCGSNYDLSHEGSDKWLATIPMSTRAQVYYYTTQYADYSWCSLPANAVLAWPNDGTTEKAYADLKGGNNMGHTKKQCHTADMKYPSQCQDAVRNKAMSDFAQLH